MHLSALHWIAFAVVLTPTLAWAADTATATNTAAAPDVTIMTQAVNPKAALQNKRVAAEKAKRPATLTPAKAAP